MKLVITESQLKRIIEQQAVQQGKLSQQEQTLLGFLNYVLSMSEDDGNFKSLQHNVLFNKKTIYPMAQQLLNKKLTGKPIIDMNEFNALNKAMMSVINASQAEQLFNSAANLTKINYVAEFN